MALHISGKLCAVGFVLAILITAFSAPPKTEKLVNLTLVPSVTVTETARVVETSSRLGPVATPVFTLKATAYNSHASQTDSTPNITATGAETRFGIIAVSRDLLGSSIPYGSLVRIKDLGSYYNGRGAGRFQDLLAQTFIVEDTMHARKRNQIDVWFPRLSDAVSWGVRQVEVEVVRYGRAGPELYAEADSDFTTPPRLSAVK